MPDMHKSHGRRVITSTHVIYCQLVYPVDPVDVAVSVLQEKLIHTWN
jgi:hypothetical protein